MRFCPTDLIAFNTEPWSCCGVRRFFSISPPFSHSAADSWPLINHTNPPTDQVLATKCWQLVFSFSWQLLAQKSTVKTTNKDWCRRHPAVLVLSFISFVFFSLLEVLCELTLRLTVTHRCIVEVFRFKVCVQVELDAGMTDLHEKMCLTPPLKSNYADINISIYRSVFPPERYRVPWNGCKHDYLKV